MEQVFSRKSASGTIGIILGVLTILGGLRHNEYRLIPEFLYYIAGAIFIIYALWTFMVPYIIIGSEYITIKESPFEAHELKISAITKINFSVDEIEIEENTEYATINLKTLSDNDRNELVDALKKIKPTK